MTSAPTFAHTNVTELIIKGFYQVYNELGYGFLEKVYENAMVIVLEEIKRKAFSNERKGSLSWTRTNPQPE